jgi:hypothetical protein
MVNFMDRFSENIKISNFISIQDSFYQQIHPFVKHTAVAHNTARSTQITA